MSLNNITGKTYGLIIPNKRTSKKVTQVAPVEKAFAEESDDEAEFRTPNFDAKLETLKTSIRKTTKVNLEKALEEDASVFQYDEVYDKITREKEEKVLEKTRPSARTSKYVDKLMQASTVRKLEKELLNERKAQRELEADKEKYGDKEAFVTSAYKAKMAELRELVERRHEEESREEVMDVTKQDGLGGFYRYMYQQKTASRPESSSTTASQASKSQNTDAHKDAKTERFSTHHTCDDKDVKIEKPSSSRTQSPPLRRHGESRYAGDRRVPEEKHSSSSRHHHRHRSNDNRHHRTIRRHSSSSSREGRYSSHRGGREHRKHRTTERGGGESTESSSRKNEVSKSATPAPPALPPPPPGFIHAKPRITTEEEVEAFRQRFLARKAAGLNKPKIVLSDDET